MKIRCWKQGVVGFLALALAGASEVAGQQARFGGEETVVAVEIPVQVLVDGKPVTGLSRENFEVREGRKERKIVDFEVVNLSMATTASGKAVAEEPNIPAAGRRNFLLLFDLTNSDPSAITRARAAAHDLVRREMHPSDLVAVATWSFTKGPRLLLGFTTDRRQVDAAVETLGVVDIRNRQPDPLGLIVAELDNSTPSAGGGGGGGGNRPDGDAIFEENMRQFAIGEQAAERQVRGSEVAALTQGFAGLAHALSSVVGRKYVVLLSQGFDASQITGANDAAADQRAAQAAERGEYWSIDSNERYGDTRSANQLEAMLDEFRRSDCAIQAVDIGGLAVGGDAGTVSRRSSRDSLLTMARDTGGMFIENFNDLGDAMGSLLEATSVTYVLTIQPQDLKLDGKYHAIKVKLEGGPSGATLVHRPGYFAPLPYQETSATGRQLSSAQLLLAGESGGELAAGVVAAAFRGEADRMHVPVVVQVDGPSLAQTRGGSNAIPLAIYSYAFDTSGTVVDYFAQAMQLDYGKVGGLLSKDPLRFVGDLRLPAGSYRLRTLVRAGEGGVSWVGDTPLEVPAFAPGELDVVEPLIPAPINEGVVVRSATSAERTSGLPFPFILGSAFFLPNALPVVRREQAVRACVNVYGLSNGEVQVTSELVGEDGHPAPGAQVKVVESSRTDQPGLQRIELEVQPGATPSGLYTLRVTVEQEGRSASSSAPLRVGA